MPTVAIEVALPGANRERLTLRVTPSAVQEHALLEHLKAQGYTVPAPLYSDDSGELLSAPYLVLEYVEGAIEIDPPDREGYARQLAAQLAAIHEVPSPPFELPSMAARMERLIARAPPPSEVTPEEQRAREALLAARPVEEHGTPRLLHGDYWPGNVLWQDGEVASVIDWEDAALGDPLADLAGCRLDLRLIVGRDVSEAFTLDYLAASSVDDHDLPYWDLVAAIHAAPHLGEWAAGWRNQGHEEISEASMRVALGESVGSAIDALEMR